MDIKLIVVPAIPQSVYALVHRLQIAFQQKTVDKNLLQTVGQVLWEYANLPVDISTTSQILIQTPHDLPWECLYHPDGYFIIEHVAITRTSIDIGNEPKPNTPLRILHFATQTANAGSHYLNFCEEQISIYQALWASIQTKQVLLYSTQYADINQFKALLKQNWDIIILSGHSIQCNGKQYFVFKSFESECQLVSYDEIILILKQRQPLCLVLAVCETRDLAYQLHQQGIPYVIGMQHAVLDRASNVFIQQLLYSIGQGHTLVDAVQTARLAMQTLLNPDEQWSENELGQWLNPCFFARTDVFPSLIPLAVSIENYELQILIGRQAEFHELQTGLIQHKTVWLYGAGGVGKTALARAIQQHYIAQHQELEYIEVTDIAQPIEHNTPILAVSRYPPPEPHWFGFHLAPACEHDFIRYIQHQGMHYPQLQLRLIYKMLRGNYQGLQLLKGLPYHTEAQILRKQLYTVQRYLQAYQRPQL